MQKLSYTGSAITPVTVKDGETTLTKDTDYEVGLSWSDTTFVEQPLRCEKYTSRPPAKPLCFVQTAILSYSLTESKILLSIRCQ